MLVINAMIFECDGRNQRGYAGHNWGEGSTGKVPLINWGDFISSE